MLLDAVAEIDSNVALMEIDETMNFIQNSYRSGFSSVQMLKEPIRSVFTGLNFRQFSPFYEILNEKILRLFAGGILQYVWNCRINPKGIKQLVEKIGPQVLTMDHIGIGFIFCSVSLSVAIIAFVVEITTPWFENLFRRRF